MGRALWRRTGLLVAATTSVFIGHPPPLQAQASPPQVRDTLLYERLDLYDPVTSAFTGSEVTYWGPDGRRLRLEVTDADGDPSLLFYLRHDEVGRESEGVYFESGPFEPRFERFTYSPDGRMKTTEYVTPDGGTGERTESDLGELGREVFKRYYRADGSQYGEEDVLWNEDGTSAGWDFRYVGREGRAVYTYEYEPVENGVWTRRVRRRDGDPERVEVRTTWRSGEARPLPTPARFAPGRVSTEGSETSPSFTGDGRTMVFARYGEDWGLKEPFIALLHADGWLVEELPFGPVYNLAVAPDGTFIIFSRSAGEARTLHRVRKQGDGWSQPEDLTTRYGLAGAYPVLTSDGDLYLYDANGPDGAGIYFASKSEEGFGPAQPVYVPERGDAFDAYVARTGGPMLVTRCFDTTCATGATNGVWHIDLETLQDRKLATVPYGWGAQPVQPLGVFVFTDGEDILALPRSVAIPERGLEADDANQRSGGSSD